MATSADTLAAVPAAPAPPAREGLAAGTRVLLEAPIPGTLLRLAALTVGMLWGGPPLYRAMGGTGGALAAALTYSNVVFAGAGAFWLFNTLGSVLRGAGNMGLPAVVVVVGGAFLVVLSPALIWGWGPLPRLGSAGAGVG